MQGDELRAIRKALGLTLAGMAEALGMSETMVGQMERGQKLIERRTALAALYLAEHPEALGQDAPEPAMVSIPRLER